MSSSTAQAVPPPKAAPPPRARVVGRARLLLLATLGVAWAAVAEELAGRAARGIAERFGIDEGRGLLAALFTVFLLAVGYRLLETIGMRRASGLRAAAGLPVRSSARGEWALGALLGWAMAVAAVLPIAIAGDLRVRFWTAPRAFELLLLNVATLLLAALAVEMALRGFTFRYLVEAIGATTATLVMVAGVAAFYYFRQGPGAGVWVAMLFALLLAVSWLRTRAVWLAWGLHFAWSASVAVLFGLPVAGSAEFSSLVEARATGSGLLSGNGMGPEAATLTAVLLLAGIWVLVRLTDDYAWEYARREIVPAGYEVSPEAPAAHAAMEAVGQSPGLVQILPNTPQSRSVELP